jgi:hypothetical protein
MTRQPDPAATDFGSQPAAADPGSVSAATTDPQRTHRRQRGLHRQRFGRNTHDAGDGSGGNETTVLLIMEFATLDVAFSLELPGFG